MRGVRVGKDQIAYWKSRVRPRVLASGRTTAELYLRIKQDGRIAWLPLLSSNRADAAKTARDLWLEIQQRGLSVVLAERSRPAPPARLATVGELLATARTLAVPARLRPRSFALCEAAMRKIVAGVAGIEGDVTRFDYRTGGAERWRARIDAVSLAEITKTAVERWRNEFVATAGNDLSARESRARSASSYIRCCRSLFSRNLLPDLRKTLALPAPSPFEGIGLVESVRPFEATVDAASLYRAAWDQLRGQADILVAFCLLVAGGLRRAEADLLPWRHVDLDAGTLRIDTTQHFQPKSRQSRRTIRLPLDVIALLRERRAALPDAEFVLAGGVPKPAGRSNRYRAHAWQPLSNWLQGRGVAARTPLHDLRKLAGSLINTQGGLAAARAFLGHRDIKTTIGSYVHVTPHAVDFGVRPQTTGERATSAAQD